MPEPARAPSKSVTIDALVLVFSHSKVRDIVGTDALRTVVSVEYRDLTANGYFDLQAIWELLEEQPGFDADAAVAPMCRFKTWQRHLNMEVRLPDALRNMSEGELATAAAECVVPTPDMQRLFRADLTENENQRKAQQKSKKGKPKGKVLTALNVLLPRKR